MTSLETLVEYFPDKKWSWGAWGLSKNPGITQRLIERTIDKPWNWRILSGNPVITPDFIEHHLDKEWSYYGEMSSNPSITPEFIERHFYDNSLLKTTTKWSFPILSGNPAITPEFIERHPNQMWNWGKGGLSKNPSITQELIEQYPEKPWDYTCGGGLSSNPVITPEFIKRHPEKPWDFNFGLLGLSGNPSMTPEFVLETYTTYPWSHIGLLYNPSMTLELIDTIILNESNESWMMIQRLSSSPLLTESYIESHPEYLSLWDMQGLAENPCISHEFFVEYYCHESESDSESSPTSTRENPLIQKAKLRSLSMKEPEEYLVYLETEVFPGNTESEVFKKHIYEFDTIRTTHFADPIAKSTSAPYYSHISKYPSLTADFVIKNFTPEWKWDFGELGLSSNPMMRNHQVNKQKLLEWNGCL
jgi:hypothetical protein